MATRSRLDPEAQAIIERARRRAAAAGEFARPRSPSAPVELSEAARAVLCSWLDDGGYAAALASVVEDDPELANQ